MTHPLPEFPAFTPEPPAPRKPSFLRRHRTALVIVAAVLVLAGGATWAVAASHDPHSSTASSATPSTSSPAPSPGSPSPTGSNGSKAGKHATATRGVITGESGSTWTMRTQAGSTVTVTVGARTKFGTAKAPATKAQLTVGKQVVVSGPVSDGKVDAKRIHAVTP